MSFCLDPTDKVSPRRHAESSVSARKPSARFTISVLTARLSAGPTYGSGWFVVVRSAQYEEILSPERSGVRRRAAAADAVDEG